MPKGLSIHLGLGTVDPAKYAGVRDLRGAPNDACRMHEIATDQGFTACLLVDEKATLEALHQELHKASTTLRSGDMLLITFSGHGDAIMVENWDPKGFQGVPGPDNLPIEIDGKNERFCLYDGAFADDDFYTWWAQFQDGVRIVIVADSCGTATISSLRPTWHWAKPAKTGLQVKVRAKTRAGHPFILPASRGGTRTTEIHDIRPVVLVISASQDNSTTKDASEGEEYSKFTQGLLKAWSHQPRDASYSAFYDRVTDEALNIQPALSPSYRIIGRDNAIISSLEAHPPFSI